MGRTKKSKARHKKQKVDKADIVSGLLVLRACDGACHWFARQKSIELAWKNVHEAYLSWLCDKIGLKNLPAR